MLISIYSGPWSRGGGGGLGGKCHQFLFRGQFLPLLQLYDITLITAVELN